MRRLKAQSLLGIFLMGISILAAAGCGNVDEQETPVSTQQQPVTVIPEFQVDGIHQVPEHLHLTELGVTISEVRFESTTEDEEGPALANREPIRMNFNIDEGEVRKEGEELVLPESGTYRVSVRLEPIDDGDVNEADEEGPYSFAIGGFIASGENDYDAAQIDGRNTDGDPVPLPFDEEDEEQPGAEMNKEFESSSEWTPFSYQSQDSVYYTVGEFEFDDGEQFLSFRFDVSDWAKDVAEPIREAVTASYESEPEQDEREEVVDVTREIDRTDRGPQAIRRHMMTRILPSDRGM